MRMAEVHLAKITEQFVSDVDFRRGIVSSAQQHPDKPLKTEMARTPIPIPQNLALTLSAHVAQFSGEWLLTNDWGHQLGPWQLNGHSGPLGPRRRTCPRGSDSMTYATTTPACSSRPALT